MKTSFHHFIIFQLFLFFNFSQCQQHTCPVSSCDQAGPKVRFPFRIRDKQLQRCGYPGFDLHCNHKNKTILDMPNAGEFIVNQIDYKNQYLFINDPNPDPCLGKRVLNFSTLGSPFTVPFPKKMAFLKCSQPGNWWNPYDDAFTAVFCLETRDWIVLAADPGFSRPRACRFMVAVEVPIQEGFNKRHAIWSDLTQDFQLTWWVAGCGSCEKKGGTCGYLNTTSQEIVCFDLPRGISRNLKYGLSLGIGIASLVLCLVFAVLFILARIRRFNLHHRPQLDLNHMNLSMVTQPGATGLDGATIESYSKTILGESRRLPNPSHKICSICLGEYQPHETLRTIPKCNHYFHADCVDEWLRLNPTCPLCRKSPIIHSSAVTPTLPVSSTLLS